MACYLGLDSENDCRGTPCNSCTANDPTDFVSICKMAVIKAACGIKALEDDALLERLEGLFLEGATAGLKAQNKELQIEVAVWKARAEAMLNVADYEMRKQILGGHWP